MNNLVCISDCHLGYRHRLKAQRLQHYLNAFNDAVAKAQKCDPDIILFAGDIVHHSRPDPVTLRSVVKTLVQLAEKTQIVLCIGNHEIEGHLSTTYTPIYSDLHKNIHVLSSENPHVRLNLIGRQVDFYGFEYTRNQKSAEKKLLDLSKSIHGGFNVLCLHQAVERYLSPPEISIKTLREVAPKYNLILFGHIHKPQPIKEVFDVTPAYFIGSTEHISFNESESPTGILLFRNLDARRPEHIKVNSASMKQVREDLGKKTPEEINQRVEELIKQNHGTDLLQIDINASIDGDILNIRHDWAEQHPEHAILDVAINPAGSASAFSMEKIETSEETIREYFKKTGQTSRELEETCVKLYQKYGG
ncbi:MAG: DNA repair exonuclease [Candidatus Altiarchaeota archaeon]|nr:DNA repair exonuclease [Candidatus Altiarchaeota archaeon]